MIGSVAIQQALAAPAKLLNDRLDRLGDLIQGMTEEQRRTNELLEILASGNSVSAAKLARKKPTPRDGE